MTGWPIWGVLMLVVYSEANFSLNDMINEIEEGRKKIQEMAQESSREKQDAGCNINTVFLTISQPINVTLPEGMDLYQNYSKEVHEIVSKSFDDAIDKNKNTTIFLTILEINKKTESELRRALQNLMTQAAAVKEQKKNELQNLENLLDFTEKFFTELYEGLKDDMGKCKDTKCITDLISAAEKKRQNLTEVFKKYTKEISNISAGFKDGLRHCLPRARKEFWGVMKQFEYDMDYHNKEMGVHQRCRSPEAPDTLRAIRWLNECLRNNE